MIDRVRIAKEGLIIIIVELVRATGQLAQTPEILTKGLIYEKKDELAKKLGAIFAKRFSGRQEPMTSTHYYKKTIEKTVEEILYREGRSPLVVPVIIEV